MRYPVPRPKKPTARGGKEDWGRLTTDWIRDTDIRLHPYQRVPPPGGRIGCLPPTMTHRRGFVVPADGQSRYLLAVTRALRPGLKALKRRPVAGTTARLE